MRDMTSLTFATGRLRNFATMSRVHLAPPLKHSETDGHAMLLSTTDLSYPRHQRGVDDIGQTLPADGLDREVRVLQPEAVGGDPFQRKRLDAICCSASSQAR